MTKKPRQLVIFITLCGILVCVAVFRLSDSPPPTPATAAASVTTATGENTTAAPEIPEISLPESSWRLPELESIADQMDSTRNATLRNPFVISDRIRLVIEQTNPASTVGKNTASQETYVAAPEFVVRSTFQVSGNWYAEIDDRTYGFGDVIGAFQILEITQTLVRVVPLNEDQLERQAESGALTNPACLLRGPTGTVGLVNGQWWTAKADAAERTPYKSTKFVWTPPEKSTNPLVTDAAKTVFEVKLKHEH